MPFQTGTRLGKYEIGSFIDAGGMGEVYRARDTELKHEVAIKLLPEAFARDSERIARFEREARMLAQVNHPNICVLYDLKREGELVYLVLELVLGDTLAQRLEGGPLEVGQALPIFRQIALALEAAHGKGVVHRDLKPQNVKITPDGLVKVLDFGLAKESFEASDDDKTQTGPKDLSREGIVVGTASYMSPEQTRGLPVDKRTDIWAFGCCLFEALSDRRPFEGETYGEIREAIRKKEPDFDLLPSDVPVEVKKLIHRCLRKDPRERLRDVADARFVLEEVSEAPGLTTPPTRPSPWLTALWIVGALAAGVLTGTLISLAPPAAVSTVHRFVLALPPTEPMALGTGPSLALSSDGASLMYATPRGDTTELRRRPMDQLEIARVPGTEGAHGLFFHGDTQEIGFFAKAQMFRLVPGDAKPVSLGESPSPRGASWLADRIVFSPRTESGLSWIERGASEAELTTLDPEKGERSHRWPSILPGGEGVLFTCWNDKGFNVEAVNIRTKERKLLVEDGTYARYAATGHLLFVRDFALMAQPFDPERLQLSAEPVKVVEGVHYDRLTGAAFYDVSSDGTLAYAAELPERDDADILGRLLVLDRESGAAGLLNPVSRAYQVPRLSPSGRDVLMILTERGSTDVWSMAIDRASLSRITFDGQSGVAVWHPDGDRIAFAAQRGEAFNIFSKTIGSSESERRLTESPNTQFPTSFSPDGSRLAYVEFDRETGLDIWIWSLREPPKPFQRTTFNESAAVFSPDGRYIAYVSNETEQDEVYVRPADGSGKWSISTEGGVEPVWSRDGTELFYRDGEWMMVVEIETEGGFEPGAPDALFEAPFDEAGAPYANYDVSKDGKKLYMVRTDEGREAKELIVVAHWFRELSEMVPARR